jgi:hypothetical protein
MRGIALDGSGGSASPGPVLGPAEIRSIRESANAESPLVLRVMRAAMDVDPFLRLMILANSNDQAGPPDGADMIVWRPAASAREAATQAEHLRAAGWFRPGTSGRILLSVPRLDPRAQSRSIRTMQAQGANAMALCPWVASDNGILAPVFSAATFPHRP